MKRIHRTQQGFAAIAAIFLVVILAALGAFMVTFSNTQQLTSAQDVQGSRAYWAAHSGLDWEISQVIAANSCPAATATLVIDPFNVEIKCDAIAYDDGVPVTMIKMTSAACTKSPCGSAVGSIGYVERSLSASIER
jgi:MSHA biogenesis protein MshP